MRICMKNKLLLVSLGLVLLGQKIWGMPPESKEGAPLLPAGKPVVRYSGPYLPGSFWEYIRIGNVEKVCELLKQDTCYAYSKNGEETAYNYAFRFVLENSKNSDCKYFKILRNIGTVLAEVKRKYEQKQYDKPSDDYLRREPESFEAKMQVAGLLKQIERPLANASRCCCCIKVYYGPWLHQAVDADNLELVRLLFEHRIVGPLSTNSKGLTALAFARSEEMAQLLIEKGVKNSARFPHVEGAGGYLRATDVVWHEGVRVVIHAAEPQYYSKNCCSCSCREQFPGCLHAFWACLDWINKKA